MTKDPKNQQRSIMLAANVGSYSKSAVGLAVQMAASMNAELRGLFIEDEDLLQVTDLPITREISLTTARERPTSVAQMQRSMRAVARRFEAALKREARAFQISWRFDYVRGRARDLVLQQGSDETYVILGQPVSHRLRSRRERVSRRILLIANRSRFQKRALEVVLECFSHEKVAVTLVDKKPGGKLAIEIAQLGLNTHCELSLDELNRDRMFKQLVRLGSGFDCAIISRHEDPRVLAQILKTLICPVILVA